jgi:circadian clock protein KaiB
MKGKPRVENEYDAFERAIERAKVQKYVLRLYISGLTPKSISAISQVRELCEKHLKDRCQLEVIDVYQQPVLAKGEQILAVPTLVKHLPRPLRKFIGSMANTERILLGLDFRPTVQ